MEPNIERVRERAQKVVGAAAGRASSRARSAAGVVAHETHTLASVLRGAAEQAEREGSRVVHEPLRKMADFCEQLAGRAEEQDPRQLINGLTDLGRREPLMLFGAATAVALLGRRVMRAGAAAEPGMREDNGNSNGFQGQSTGSASTEASPLQSATFTPPESSMPPLESPPTDREIAIAASTSGGMSEAQAEAADDLDDLFDTEREDR